MFGRKLRIASGAGGVAKCARTRGWDTVPAGIPCRLCRLGYRAGWDTVPTGIPCRLGYRAGFGGRSGACVCARHMGGETQSIGPTER